MEPGPRPPCAPPSRGCSGKGGGSGGAPSSRPTPRWGSREPHTGMTCGGRGWPGALLVRLARWRGHGQTRRAQGWRGAHRRAHLGLPVPGGQKSSASQKPRGRGIFHSLFCCVCRDDGEALPSHSGAPLLVEENGAVPKVRGGQVRAAGPWARPPGGDGKGFFLTSLQALEGLPSLSPGSSESSSEGI